MKYAFFLIASIPLFIFAFIIFYSPDNTMNQRTGNTNNETFESKMQDEAAFGTETRDNINELETEILAESESDDTREIQLGDNITVNYRGWLASNGDIFDQSFNRGNEGFTFEVGGPVIDGWNEGVIGMKQGEVRRLYIPSSKGYGEFGSPPAIPENADLIFDVELIRFE